ncbi:hypothetical protein [Massilia antarctica]|uniref:hypothetical protein n=1 Tax=Massilia antarctica TaxID=2765360 RepID=UPI0006BB9425|nr:hypothetical protein [Massilia sp. H27-R4]MCY0912206.1 hypothetical protein [Massilia sp. H27-R4]CUI06303.1 hypothetical protein BN2497_7383 [Janthinobacterium sp. CG23_2]CUU30089.1 hypothetical protein BN3177_7383 [Janthinobacterium sp. CG23_2]
MARINEIINFLESNAPAELVRLRSGSADHVRALVPDLGGVASPATLIQAQAALHALRLWAAQLPRLLALEIGRLNRIGRYEDLASLLTMVAGGITAIAAFLPPQWLWLKIGAALATLAGSGFAWEAKRRGRMVFQYAPGALAAILADAGSSVNQWIVDLEAYIDPRDPHDYTSRVEKVLEQANTLFRELNRAQLALVTLSPTR